MARANVEALNGLLKAPSKEVVEQVFFQAFLNARGFNGRRPEGGLGASQSVLKKMGEALELTPVQTEDLLLAVALLIEDAIFENRAPSEIVAALPAELNKSLKQLIAAIITKNMPKWRETVAASQISLPRLVDSDWRIDLKTASEVIARMAQPAVIVDLRVQEAQTQAEVLAPTRSIAFEMNKETLETMLDGLGKIRDQLASITAAPGGAPASS